MDLGREPNDEGFLQAIASDALQVVFANPRLDNQGNEVRKRQRQFPLLYTCRTLYLAGIKQFYKENTWTFSSPESLWDFVTVVGNHEHIHLVERVQLSIQVFGCMSECTSGRWTDFFLSLADEPQGLKSYFPGLRELKLDFATFRPSMRMIRGDFKGSCLLWADRSGGQEFDILMEALWTNVRAPAVDIVGIVTPYLSELTTLLVTGEEIEFSDRLAEFAELPEGQAPWFGDWLAVFRAIFGEWWIPVGSSEAVSMEMAEMLSWTQVIDFEWMDIPYFDDWHRWFTPLA